MNSSTEMSVSEAPERLTWRETGSPARSRSASISSARRDHPAVELLHHPRALGGLDEGGGRQQLAVLAGHPQQQLVALDPAGGEAADRLRGEAEPVLGEGVADPGAWSSGRAGPRASARAGSSKRATRLRPSSLARYIAWSAATSTASAPASRLPPNIVMPTLIVAAPDLGVRREALGDLRAQVLAELHRAGGVGLRHQHRELVAGEAGDDVGGPHPLAQDVGDAADQVVADLVAEPVVDLP